MADECPTNATAAQITVIDVQAVNLMITIYSAVETIMEANAALTATKRIQQNLIIGCGKCCKKIWPCRFTLCQLINLINTTPPQAAIGTSLAFSVLPFAFGKTKSGKFKMIADPFTGGLNGNQKLYDKAKFKILYKGAKKSPMGAFVNHDAFFEGTTCKYPARTYVRIFPHCYEEFPVVIFAVGFLLANAITGVTTVTTVSSS
jgi:hypothetical protein